MDDHEIRAVGCVIEIEERIVAPDLDPGHQRGNIVQCVGAALADRIRSAPAVDRLENDDLVAQCVQFTRVATEEMCVAVVPAGRECMVEQDAYHAGTLVSPSLVTRAGDASRSW